MSVEILVNATPRETRAAVLENGVLQEIYVERVSRRGLVSNLYKGRVSRVLPGMQAAFVDIGLERTAFLHAADIAFMRPDETMVSLPAIDDIRRLVNRHEGRASHHLRGPAFAVSRVHAAGRGHRCVGPHRG
jgi:ribonuclease G